jgi:hypothetical protein
MRRLGNSQRAGRDEAVHGVVEKIGILVNLVLDYKDITNLNGY